MGYVGRAKPRLGHFSEIIVAGVLNNYDNREVEGKTYFGLPEPILLPRMEDILRREGVIKEDAIHEIDVVGEHRLTYRQEGNAGFGAWLVSVRYR